MTTSCSGRRFFSLLCQMKPKTARGGATAATRSKWLQETALAQSDRYGFITASNTMDIITPEDMGGISSSCERTGGILFTLLKRWSHWTVQRFHRQFHPSQHRRETSVCKVFFFLPLLNHIWIATSFQPRQTKLTSDRGEYYKPSASGAKKNNTGQILSGLVHPNFMCLKSNRKKSGLLFFPQQRREFCFFSFLWEEAWSGKRMILRVLVQSLLHKSRQPPPTTSHHTEKEEWGLCSSSHRLDFRQLAHNEWKTFFGMAKLESFFFPS